MNMKINDFTNLKKYHNRWVAIEQDGNNEVIGVGNTLRQALEEAKKKGVKDPILTKVPADYGAFIL